MPPAATAQQGRAALALPARRRLLLPVLPAGCSAAHLTHAACWGLQAALPAPGEWAQDEAPGWAVWQLGCQGPEPQALLPFCSAEVSVPSPGDTKPCMLSKVSSEGTDAEG